MKTTTIFSAAMGWLIMAFFLTTACGNEPVATDAAEAGAVVTANPSEHSQEALIRRGAYLVTIAGCDDCHTPKKMTDKGPVPDMDRRLMGFPVDQPLAKLDPEMVAPGNWVAMNGDLTAAAGPWGISFAANLTPDPTGIGFWTEENFFKSVREGKLKGLDGSRPLLPPMPWQNLAQASDEDLRAIFAFLKSIKPIKNAVPAPIPPDQLSSLE